MYKILIVEDDPVISKEVARGLTKWGYEAKEILDFSNVLTEFAVFDPHLVLMDISLPFYNGYPLVSGNPSHFKGPGHVPVFRLRKHEHYYGSEYGR